MSDDISELFEGLDPTQAKTLADRILDAARLERAAFRLDNDVIAQVQGKQPQQVDPTIQQEADEMKAIQHLRGKRYPRKQTGDYRKVCHASQPARARGGCGN